MKICVSYTHTHQRVSTREEVLNNSADKMICPFVVSHAFQLTTLMLAQWAPECEVRFEVEVKLMHGPRIQSSRNRD